MSDERMIRIDNLKLLKKQTGWTNEQIGERMGVTGAYIGKLLNRTTAFTEKTARKLEEHCGRPYRWFDIVHMDGKYDDESLAEAKLAQNTQKAAEETLPPYEVFPLQEVESERFYSAIKLKRAPVVAWAALEVAVSKMNREMPKEATAAFEAIVDEVSDYAKVTTVLESPITTISPGDRITVDPKRQPWEDCVVVLKLGSGKLVLRRYRSLATGGFEAICPNEPPLDSTRHNIAVVGTVVALQKMQF